MSIKINYQNNNLNKSSANLVLFVDENFNIKGLKKLISNTDFSYISDLLKTSDLKKNLLYFEINSKKTVFLVSIKNDLKTSDIENLGARFHGLINYNKNKNDYFINSDTINSKIKNFIGYFLHGLKLKSYEFNIYKSKNIKKLFL
jgi:leucyl aminopeptidase